MKNLKWKILIVLAVILVAGAVYTLGASATLGTYTASAAPLFSEDTVTSIYDNASPAVVEIKVATQTSGTFMRGVQSGQGSGFLIDGQGHILTNNHVVSGATSVQVVLKSGTTITASVTGTDSADDLALLSVPATSVTGIMPLALAPDTAPIKPGQMAIALGSPYGLTDSITVGVISGVNRSLGGSSGLMGMLQTDAAINPGNSGGPLLNAQGQVIGINTAIEAATGARGIGFAVPSTTVNRVMSSLMAGQQVTRPWLGITGMALSAAQAQTLGISVSQGVYVITVVPNGPAAKAGIKGAGTGTAGTPGQGGDVITAVDGRAVTSVEDLASYLSTKQVGNVVNLSVLRGGQTTNISATLEARPANVSTNIVPQQPAPTPSVPRGNGRFRSNRD